MKMLYLISDLPQILKERIKHDPDFIAKNKLTEQDVFNRTDLFLKALGLRRVESFERDLTT